ncbi:SEFIR domain-containing protein [Chryseobacterium sp.]|uniref:AbiTii domain-containing protein n=1 Tax=Chryseobacterium sp. TaxID=1871047 RepID=UPI0012A9332D|nr:SEFIR domain-containing protein [Chryseobacterium sp.]QFG53621.1 TIR domain-containing protein [Chryseobacterium sp.]
MENFLTKLYDTNQKLSMLLLEAKDIAEANEEFELTNYIEKELEGYKVDDVFPEYRKIKGQIVGDIKDVYGNLVHKEYNLDFTVLSNSLGFDLDDAYVPDGISFVEASLSGLSGKNAIKPMPKELVKMLDETFHFNNPHLHIVGAFHKIPIATLEYILVKVRHNLIKEFQRINRKIEKPETDTQIQEISETPTEKKRSIFITYAWEDEEYNSQIISFVNFLRENGFDASMDKKKSQEEASMNFNQMMVEGIQNSSKVIVILSEKYKQKADKFEGGVATELKIILDIIAKSKSKDFQN